MIHEDRDRASSFGEDAELYDRVRPRYPSALFDDLAADLEPDPTPDPVTNKVLDVGCGTGIAGRELARRGWRVLGVEPDPRMAAVARRHGLEVEEATFEAWEARGRTFGLLTCGQAWHWLDPATAPAKASRVLAPAGRVAVFWNQARHAEEPRRAMEAAYREVAPDVEKDSILLRASGEERFAALADTFAATDAFEAPEIRRYAWARHYSRDEWLEQLMTHSDHRVMDSSRRDRLLARVGEVFDDFGGGLDVSYDCVAVTARRSRRAAKHT